ncbi:adapter molecule Crk [Brachionus plicatilis]|uniref:Adapter molecule Crk n=1 Tax=Brachionus plicatilis TaxID=10195 RepID=A0A3M7TAA4_BRAPC|nr:adapter molecule Crk [Brachionus plicatilis]RNA44930.1 adapter molecule Crk [Brachionus plicatilis]
MSQDPLTACSNENGFTFDPNDEVSYYYGDLSRDEVKTVLDEASIGTFLIRDSTKDIDQKVLCVKEGPKSINSYKIIHRCTDDHKIQKDSHVFYIYGKEDCLFSSIPSILEFYSNHYLNQSPLIKPAFYHKKCIAMYDFTENGDPNEDLYFKKDEILSIIEYTQGENWWKASNESGKVGLVPVPLIRRLKPNEWPDIKKRIVPSKLEVNQPIIHSQKNSTDEESNYSNEKNEKCPFDARVIEDYTPSPYEHSCISLKKGQIVTVLEMRSMGKWFGQNQSNGNKGLFPFNRVEMIDD